MAEVQNKQHSTLDNIFQLGAQHNMLQKLNNRSRMGLSTPPRNKLINVELNVTVLTPKFGPL